MAISLEGYSEFSASTETGSQAVTVPTGTDFAVAFCGAYGDSSPSLNNPVCTLGSDAFTQQEMRAVSESSGHNGLSLETLVNPATGSQTLYWDWGFDPFDNQEIVIAYFSGVDPTTPVVDSKIVPGSAVTVPTSGDFIVGGTNAFQGTPDPNLWNQTEITRFTGDSGGMGVGYEAGTQTFFETTGGSWFATGAVTLNEATGGGEVTATTSAPFESLITKSVSRLGSFESLRPSARAVTGPFESVQSLDASPLLRFESMQLAQLAHDCNWESVTLARQTATYPIEAMQTVESLLTTEFESLAHALALPEIHYESLGPPQIISIADLALECLGNSLSSYAGPIEALSTPSISRSLVYESTTRRTKLNGVAMEALQRAATIHQIEMESLGRALYAATINIESLGEQLITVLAQLYFESKSVAFVPQALGTEALSNVVDEAMIIVESAKSARLQTVPHFEAIQRVVSGEILNSESIASLWVEYQGQTESLAYALRDALIPIEALKYILSSHTLPMEADGELVILMTPSWRIYTIDREIRVITISATND